MDLGTYLGGASQRHALFGGPLARVVKPEGGGASLRHDEYLICDIIECASRDGVHGISKGQKCNSPAAEEPPPVQRTSEQVLMCVRI